MVMTAKSFPVQRHVHVTVNMEVPPPPPGITGRGGLKIKFPAEQQDLGNLTLNFTNDFVKRHKM